jgi:hypothetical protein
VHQVVEMAEQAHLITQVAHTVGVAVALLVEIHFLVVLVEAQLAVLEEQ